MITIVLTILYHSLFFLSPPYSRRSSRAWIRIHQANVRGWGRNHPSNYNPNAEATTRDWRADSQSVVTAREIGSVSDASRSRYVWPVSRLGFYFLGTVRQYHGSAPVLQRSLRNKLHATECYINCTWQLEFIPHSAIMILPTFRFARQMSL